MTMPQLEQNTSQLPQTNQTEKTKLPVKGIKEAGLAIVLGISFLGACNEGPDPDQPDVSPLPFAPSSAAESATPISTLPAQETLTPDEIAAWSTLEARHSYMFFADQAPTILSINYDQLHDRYLVITVQTFGGGGAGTVEIDPGQGTILHDLVEGRAYDIRLENRGGILYVQARYEISPGIWETSQIISLG